MIKFLHIWTHNRGKLDNKQRLSIAYLLNTLALQNSSLRYTECIYVLLVQFVLELLRAGNVPIITIIFENKYSL